MWREGRSNSNKHKLKNRIRLREQQFSQLDSVNHIKTDLQQFVVDLDLPRHG